MIFKLRKTIFLFGCLLIGMFVMGCSNSADQLDKSVKPSPTFPGVSTVPTETPMATISPTRKSTRAPQSIEAIAPTEPLLQESFSGEGANDNPALDFEGETVVNPTRTPLPTAPAALPLPEIDTDASQFPWLNFTNQTTEEQVLSSAALPKIGTPVPETRFYLSPENLDQLTELAVWGKGVIHDAVYSPDGKLIYATTDLGLYVYDAETAEQVNFRPMVPEISAIAFLPNSNQIALSLKTDPPLIELIDSQTL